VEVLCVGKYNSEKKNLKVLIVAGCKGNVFTISGI
jgi:hypothetical protein